MSQYIVLSKIQVQNANAIAGFTWGFPAITGFLGFTHALSRKLSVTYKDVILGGCAVISNKTTHKIYQPKKYADFEFLQSKNPPVLAKHKNSSPPIIEEGKMNLTVSLVIELTESVVMTTEHIKLLQKEIKQLCSGMRLVGGTILDIADVMLVAADTEKEQKQMLQSIKRSVMPGFVLLDCSHYLQEHFENLQSTKPDAQLLDAWLDYSALIYTATPQLQDDEDLSEQSQAEWNYQPKPHKGYLVPLMTGYKAISELYEPNTVHNVRDPDIPARFVEAIHSIGEWKGAHAIQAIDDVIWRYQHDEQWYVCQQSNNVHSTEKSAQTTAAEFTQINNIDDILNLL